MENWAVCWIRSHSQTVRRSGGWIELKTTEQRYKSFYKRMISRWYKGGLKLYMRWFRSNSSWTHSFLFCCCQSFEDSFLSSWLAAGLGWTMVDWHLWLIPVTLVNLGDSALSAHTTDMPQKIQKYTTLVGKAFFLNNIYFLCWIFLALNRVIRSSFLFLSFSFISPSLVAEKNSKKQPIILHH